MQWWLVYMKREAYFMSSLLATLRRGLIQLLSLCVATRRGRVIHLLSLLWLALLAWLTSVAWFLTDDAFISFRYVRNLLEGHGLVFNPGEYVEGYTNFLWILELAALWGLWGLRPEQAAPWLSVAYTGGTLAALWWWLARSPSRHDRGLLAWLALGLLGSSATFAVWAAGGGLETRQFTCFIVVAVVCLAVHGSNRWGLLAASLSLAAAALTRPEGLLLAACCFGWFAAQRIASAPRTAELAAPGMDGSIARVLAAVVRRLDWRELTYLVAPFAILVTAHFLFRYGYYGEWLPNTYYAKHVRPWYESGFRYLWAAALETGLYLLLPLTWVALRERWRRDRDGTYALVLLCIGAHLYYLLRIGGDHFEYRPLDFYWPLLALPAAEGIAHLGTRIAASLRRVRWLPWRVGPRAWAVALFVPVLFYASGLQGVLLFMFGPAGWHRHIELNEENAGWLLAAPGMPALMAISNDLRRQSAQQLVRLPAALHSDVAIVNRQMWMPYEKMEHGVIPGDAVMTLYAIGIMSYYVPDLTIIDFFGLTDATVARNPVTHLNHVRRIAHDRHPPPGYLQQRGVNFHLQPAASSEAQALALPSNARSELPAHVPADYALQVGPELWMPFNVGDHQWANARFAGRDLRARNRFSLTDEVGNRLRVGSRHYVGEQFLGRFEGGLDSWQVVGEAITNHGSHQFYQDQLPIFGHVGPGFLTSYHPEEGAEPTGKALSPTFTASDGHYLALLIGGGSGEHNVGVRLLADGKEIVVWHGPGKRLFDFSSPHFEHFTLVVHPLAAVAGQPLQLELYDNDPAGHIMLDHMLLVQEVGTGTVVADARPEAG